MTAADPSGCVLVIDDDENVRVLLERQVRRLGYDVIQAADGVSGLALASARQPQVILVDLRMPGIDGHTFLRRLAAAGISASVVAMSGQGNMDDVIDVLRAGVIEPGVIGAVSDHHALGPKPSEYARLHVVAGQLINGVAGVPTDVTTPAPPEAPLIDVCLTELRVDRARLPLQAKEIRERCQEVLETLG